MEDKLTAARPPARAGEDPYPTRAEETRVRLVSLWQRSLPTVLTRLDLLDSAAAAAQIDTLLEADRTEACSIAHRLAGSLGMFGYAEGTAVARQLEAEFASPSADPATLTRLTQDLRVALHLEG